MEKINYCWLLTICLLTAFIVLLRFIQIIWLRYIEVNERRAMEITRSTEQDLLHKRKLELTDKQEEIRKFERPHEIEMKKIK